MSIYGLLKENERIKNTTRKKLIKKVLKKFESGGLKECEAFKRADSTLEQSILDFQNYLEGRKGQTVWENDIPLDKETLLHILKWLYRGHLVWVQGKAGFECGVMWGAYIPAFKVFIPGITAEQLNGKMIVATTLTIFDTTIRVK